MLYFLRFVKATFSPRLSPQKMGGGEFSHCFLRKEPGQGKALYIIRNLQVDAITSYIRAHTSSSYSPLIGQIFNIQILSIFRVQQRAVWQVWSDSIGKACLRYTTCVHVCLRCIWTPLWIYWPHSQTGLIPRLASFLGFFLAYCFMCNHLLHTVHTSCTIMMGQKAVTVPNVNAGKEKPPGALLVSCWGVEIP